MNSQQNLVQKAIELEKLVDDLLTVIRTVSNSTVSRLEDFYSNPPPSDDERARVSNQECQSDLS